LPQLIWGGSRYLANGLCSLFHQDLRLVRHPVQTVRDFKSVFGMVVGCIRERSFLLDKQPHLVSWLPIAVPLTQWVIWPPPFMGNPFGALGPLGIFPLFFKFYDSLCGFQCPPSHIMTKARTARCVPSYVSLILILRY
jgi:glycerol-3-phosphate dehydrogenase